MSIWITGDTHGGIDMHKLSRKMLKGKISEGDYLIILGDFGFPFLDKETEQKRNEYHYWMNWFKERKYTVLWIDGNHDNFNFWEKQPITEKFGGRTQVHPEAENVFHLMRGEFYNIEGKSFFVFGGAASHDKAFREPNVSWWEQEIATDEEKQNTLEHLTARNFKVDYVLTHTPPLSIAEKFRVGRVCDKTAEFLDGLMNSIEYKLWLCGHVHEDLALKSIRLRVMYDDVKKLSDIEGEFY